MNDINKLKDYRKKYKRYYGIEFSKNYVIHHIDLNHENNDIDNLLLMPMELHSKYHYYVSLLSELHFSLLIYGSISQHQYYSYQVLSEFMEIVKECNKWFDFKKFLDGKIPNINNIKLEDLLK